jgi:hypothetical protein
VRRCCSYVGTTLRQAADGLLARKQESQATYILMCLNKPSKHSNKPLLSAEPLLLLLLLQCGDSSPQTQLTARM